ncbi:hypothetical protein DSM05_08560 [Pseudomonas sp. FW305-3-2-15-E-TSA4]|nr:hypothetical protein [Pseudomonas sp. FW305-3-2-15-E-TSA4]
MAACPVCKWELDFEPTQSFEICPCCGTHFGYDDAKATHAELRQKWIAAGLQWWSQSTPRPDGWDAEAQLQS